MAGWSDFGMEAGFSFLKQGLSFMAAKNEAKAQKKWQEYKNKMLRIQNGQNQNAIMLNANMAKEAAAEKSFAIDRSAYTTKASATVSAAAVGVEGRSVDQVMMGISRNQAYAQQSVKDELGQQYVAFDQQRRASALNLEVSLDRSPIPSPTAADFLMGLSGDIGKLWKETNQKVDPRTGSLG